MVYSHNVPSRGKLFGIGSPAEVPRPSWGWLRQPEKRYVAIAVGIEAAPGHYAAMFDC